MLDKLFEPVQRGLLWFSSKPNRLRVRGARIEVMAFVVTRRPELSILLGKSSYHDMWMPPQEGVKLQESFEEALRRCLEVECCLELPRDPGSFERKMYVRSYRFIGLLDLQRERWGERPVADDASGTALESVQLRRKGYWMATVLLLEQSDISPRPDGKELLEVRWFAFAEAAEAIRRTNHPEKADLLLKALELCRRDVLGGMSPQQRSSLSRGPA